MKILAIASAGGHWTQLLRLTPAFEGMDLVFVSTKDCFLEEVSQYKYYTIEDFSRKNKSKIPKTFKGIIKILRKEKPEVVLTTGAAPGLISLLVAKIFGIKTIWIDSIANVEKLSMSGKIASYFADRAYTQWAHLASNRVIYRGNVLS